MDLDGRKPMRPTVTGASTNEPTLPGTALSPVISRRDHEQRTDARFAARIPAERRGAPPEKNQRENLDPCPKKHAQDRAQPGGTRQSGAVIWLGWFLQMAALPTRSDLRKR